MTTAEFYAASEKRRAADAAVGMPSSVIDLRDQLENMQWGGAYDSDLLRLLDALVTEVERLSKPPAP